MLPGMNPGGWLLDVTYPDGTGEVVALGPDPARVRELAEAHAGSGAFVTVYDGDSGEPTLIIGVL